jgi:protein-tyrosine phosphatase
VIDLHSHVLPGLDDGAAQLEVALAILRAAQDDGVDTIVATPHVREDYPTTAAQMGAALAELRSAARRAGLTIEVLPGGELALDALARLDEDERSGFWLGGRPGLLLVETPYHGWASGIESVSASLASDGVTMVLAHPERNPAVQDRPELLRRVVDRGAMVQLTAASLDGRLGRRSAATARALLDAGLAHVVASDAHAPEVRSAGLSGVGVALADPELALWLTSEVPTALLAGEAIPARPGGRQRGWLRRRAR